jgi:1-acyl-sn-glycerol-3-phosphate acyltransferase
LRQGEVLGIFPEGGIDEYREERGHLGVGYLALKTGATVVPAAIVWDTVRPLDLGRALITPGKAVVRYGVPMVFQVNREHDKEKIRAVTANIMEAIQSLRIVKS